MPLPVSLSLSMSVLSISGSSMSVLTISGSSFFNLLISDSSMFGSSMSSCILSLLISSKPFPFSFFESSVFSISEELEELEEPVESVSSSLIISETTSGLESELLSISSSSSLCRLFPINTPIKQTTIDADITTTLSLFFNTFCKLSNIIYIYVYYILLVFIYNIFIP